MSEQTVESTLAQDQPDQAIAFISYAREDEGFAHRLDETLRLKGIDVRADWQLTRGDGFSEQLRIFIRDSDAFIFVISPDSVGSVHCLSEIDIADSMKKRIFPVLYRNHGSDDLLPAAVKEPQWTLLTEDDDFVEEIQKLLEAINTDFELMPEHRQLLTAADVWDRNGRNPSYLLRKEGLKKAQVWLQKTSLQPTKLPKPTALQSEYLLNSEMARNRGLRSAFAVAVGLALLLGGLTLFAFLQRGYAQSNQALAEDQKKIAEFNEGEAKRNALAANQQEQMAVKYAADANTQRVNAENNAAEAERRRIEAEKATENERIAKNDANEKRLEAEKATQRATEALMQTYIESGRQEINSDLPFRAMAYLSKANEMTPLTKDPGKVATLNLLLAKSIRSINLLSFDTKDFLMISPDGRRALALTGNIATVRNLDTMQTEAPLDHGAIISYAKFSADGKRLLTAGTDGFARVWSLDTGLELASFLHPGPVAFAAFSPGGNEVLTFVTDDTNKTSNRDTTVRIWSIESKKLAISIPHREDVSSAEFSPDEGRVLTVSKGVARVWDVNVTQGTATAKPFSVSAKTAQFGGNGEEILTFDEKDASVRKSETGELIHQIKIEDELRDLDIETTLLMGRFSSDGTKFVTFDYAFGNTAYVWDLGKKKIVASFSHQQGITSASFSPDGNRLVTSSNDRTAKIWDLRSRQSIATLEHPAGVFASAFLGTNKVQTIGYDGKTRLWDLDTKNIIASVKGQDKEILPALSTDGKTLLTVANEKTANLWSAENGRFLGAFEHKGKITEALFSNDGNRLLTVSHENSAVPIIVKIWDTATKKELMAHTFRDNVEIATLSKNGKRLLTVSDEGDDKRIMVWEIDTKRTLASFLQENRINFAGLSTDGKKYFVTDVFHDLINVYDTESGKVLLTQEHRGYVVPQFSPDGNLILTVTKDDDDIRVPDGDTPSKIVRIWDLNTKRNIAFFKNPLSVSSAIFSHDGKRILTTCDDSVSTLDIKNQQLIVTLDHQGTVEAAQFPFPEKEIVTLSFDISGNLWKINFWNAKDGKPLSTAGVPSGATPIAFSSDGRKLLMVAEDQTVQILELPNQIYSPREIQEIMDKKVPYRLKDGALVPLN